MMAGVATICEVCEGKRFQASVLEYHLGGRDISEVLAMSVTEAEAFFGAARRGPWPRTAILVRFVDVGLGYITLGQPLPDAVRWRAAAAQAGHPHGREGRGLCPR